MKKIIVLIFFIVIGISHTSCTDVDDKPAEPMLIIKFKFDTNQARLNNLGQIATVLPGNAAQTPDLNGISSDYIELLKDEYTQLKEGQILFQGQETTIGGATAIDFSQSKIVNEGETYLEIPLKSVAAGEYKWLRSSISFQNFRANVRNQNIDYTATFNSFIGYNNYIGGFSIENNIFDINANKPQGFWAFGINANPYSISGQSPANATTVPNPIASTSPLPAGSSILTGQFSTPLVITGLETRDVIITLSLSVKKSFEWHEVNLDGKYQPSAGETIVDMGIRGMAPSFIK